MAAIAALLVSGCAGDESVTYERELADIGTEVDVALRNVDEAEDAPGPDELDELATVLEESADMLDEIEPPEEVAGPHDRLRSGLAGVAAGFRALADDLRAARGSAELEQAFLDFTVDPDVDAAYQDIEVAQREFAREGYRVFPARGRTAIEAEGGTVDPADADAEEDDADSDG